MLDGFDGKFKSSIDVVFQDDKTSIQIEEKSLHQRVFWPVTLDCEKDSGVFSIFYSRGRRNCRRLLKLLWQHDKAG